MKSPWEMINEVDDMIEQSLRASKNEQEQKIVDELNNHDCHLSPEDGCQCQL